MSTVLTLNLANQEVNRLLTRKLDGDRVFFDSVLYKIKKLFRSRQDQQIEEIKNSIERLSNFFYDEIDKLEIFLERNALLKENSIEFKSQFKHEIPINNFLETSLAEILWVYDKLISTLNLTNNTRSLDNPTDYFVHLRHYYKSINQILSRILLIKNSEL